MRGIHRVGGRYRKPRPRYEVLVLAVSLALIVSQSFGVMAASALGTGFSAWGWHSSSGSDTSTGETSGANTHDAARSGTSAASGSASITTGSSGAVEQAVSQTAAGNPSADLDQCANADGSGGAASDCDPVNWVNGNLGESKARYLEGDSIPYRMRFDNLATSGTHTVTIEWDTTKSDKHAIDYLTSFNRTVTTANPCAGVSSCGSPSTFAIPTDPQVSGAGVTQVAGNFTLFDGTITSVSAYSYPDGSGFAGDTSARITITFTASQPDPVLAWGGHIATRADWGFDNSAVNISGSPYHMRLIDLDGSGGNQDRSLSEQAVIFPASITIVKDAQPNDPQDFSFSTTGGLTPSTFSLDDDNNPTLSNTQVFNGIISFGTYTVTEGLVTNWNLSALDCTVDVAGVGGTKATGDVATRTATISLTEGAEVTCKFTNTQLAASIQITKVADQGTVSAGEQIGFVVTVTNAGAGTATGVAVADTLPTNAGLSWSIDAGGSSPGWSIANGVLSFGPATLAAGASTHVHITSPTTKDTCGQVSNSASVTTTNDGSASVGPIPIAVTCPPPPPPGIGIQLVKGGPDLAHVGDTITYTFAVSLTTSTPLGNITLTDPICSAAPALVSKTGGNQDAILESGETWNYSCTHVVTATDPDPLPNTATVTGTASDGRQTSAQASHVVDLIHPAIRIVKTASPTSVAPGDTVTYTYKVTNTGDVTLTDVKVTDDKLGNICTIGQLEVGQTKTCTEDFLTPANLAAPIDNVGTATGRDPTGVAVQDTDKATVAVVLATTVTPPGGLAFTGAGGVIPLTGLALLLLLIGSAILYVTRRRKRPDAGSSE